MWPSAWGLGIAGAIAAVAGVAITAGVFKERLSTLKRDMEDVKSWRQALDRQIGALSNVPRQLEVMQGELISMRDEQKSMRDEQKNMREEIRGLSNRLQRIEGRIG